MARLPYKGGRMPRLKANYYGPGLRVRFARIPHETPKNVLRHPLYLPVTLGDFTIEEEFEHRDYTTVGAGEFSAPAGGPATARRLRTTDLETLTIDWHKYARWLTNPHITPGRAREEINKIARSKRPFEILATIRILDGYPAEVRMFATIRRVTRTLKPGEKDTRYYTLEIKEWRDNSLTRRKAKEGPRTATLFASTTLYDLARIFYGSASMWREIARANGITNWGPSTPLVQSKRFVIGDKLTIPEIELRQVRVPGWRPEPTLRQVPVPGWRPPGGIG
jgi:hypothetical protein